MNTTPELIYLYNQIEWLCNFYIAVENEPDEEDIIQELKTQIMDIYCQIISLKEASNPQSINQPASQDVFTEPVHIFNTELLLEIHPNDCY
jgi:hypothetical protein